jgi:hypothetical protein
LMVTPNRLQRSCKLGCPSPRLPCLRTRCTHQRSWQPGSPVALPAVPCSCLCRSTSTLLACTACGSPAAAASHPGVAAWLVRSTSPMHGP